MKTAFFTYLTMLLFATVVIGCSPSDNVIPQGNPGGGNPGGGNPGGGTPSPAANEVWMQNNSFSPAIRTVAVGTTVTWTNKESMNHNVTSNSGLFTSTTLGMGATYSYTFSAVGTFNYNCTLHSGMNGTIIVQ